jgi:hypothetical protein
VRVPGARWRDVWSLSRLEAVAALVSPRLWLARHWIPAGVLCFVAAAVVRDHGLFLDYGKIQGGGVLLAEALAGTYLVLAILGAPILVYISLEEARRSGMVDALRATPLSAGRILLALLAGKLRVALHFLLAALPAFALAWEAGGSAPIEKAFFPILALGLMSMSFATLLFASGKTPSAFAGWLFVYLAFQPAVLPLRVWAPGAGLYAAFRVFWPEAWTLYQLDEFVVSAAVPLSIFRKNLDLLGEGLSTAANAGAVAGWVLWTGVFLASATRTFGVERRGEPAPEEPPAEKRAWRLPKHPPGSAEAGRRWLSQSRLQVWEQGIVAGRLYRLTGRNPFVYLRILRDRGRSKSSERSTANWKLVGSLAALSWLYLAIRVAGPPRGVALDYLIIVGTFIACHHAAEVLGAHASQAEVLLSSGVRNRDVVMGALALAFLKAHPVLWCGGFYYLITEGPGEALAMLIASAGAILLASAFGAWSLAVRMRGMGRTFAAYAAFASFYLGLRSAVGAERGPWLEAMLGALLGALGLVLYLALQGGFRRWVGSRA